MAARFHWAALCFAVWSLHGFSIQERQGIDGHDAVPSPRTRTRLRTLGNPRYAEPSTELRSLFDPVRTALASNTEALPPDDNLGSDFYDEEMRGEVTTAQAAIDRVREAPTPAPADLQIVARFKRKLAEAINAGLAAANKRERASTNPEKLQLFPNQGNMAFHGTLLLFDTESKTLFLFTERSRPAVMAIPAKDIKRIGVAFVPRRPGEKVLAPGLTNALVIQRTSGDGDVIQLLNGRLTTGGGFFTEVAVDESNKIAPAGGRHQLTLNGTSRPLKAITYAEKAMGIGG